MAPTFVGRVAEVRALRDLGQQATLDRRPVAALIIGTPGSGKTSLLGELRSLLGEGEQISLCGFELERDVPLACARGLLRRLRQQPGGETIERLAFGSSRNVGPVEPVRLFEAVHRSLDALGPTVLVVDDLHWVDDASLALLHYVIRAAHEGGQARALVAACRPDPAATAYARSYRRLLGADRAITIELGPLSVEDGIRLVRELKPELDAMDALALWEGSGGSPFWLELLALSGGRESGIAEAVAERLDGIDDDGRTALTVLAITARPTTVDDVAAIEGWPATRVEGAVAELVRRGLARRDVRSLTVVHDLIRHGLLHALPLDEARGVHERVGRWLERVAGYDEQLMLQALDHLQRGGAPVLALAVRLARSSRRLLLGTAGLRRLTTVLDEADPSDPQTDILRERVAALASELGQHEEALRRWSECSSYSGQPTVAGRAALRASDAALQLAQRHEAWRQWERAQILCPGDEALRTEALAQQAALSWYLDHRPEEARRSAEAALRSARALTGAEGDPRALEPNVRRALIRALLVSTESARTGDDVASMLTYADELCELAAGLDERAHAQAVVRAALALRFLGRNTEAEARLRPAWNSCRRHVVPQAILEVGTWLATVLRSIGRLEEAEAVVQECVALEVRMAEFGPSRAVAAALPHLLALSRGDWRTAVDGLRSASAIEPDPHYRHHLHRERALALARLDPRHCAEEVREAARLALADARRAGCERCLVESTTGAAEALARVGDGDEAQALLAVAPPPSDAYNHLGWLRAQAAVHAAGDDVGQATVAVTAVIAEAEHQCMRLDALWARLDLAMLLIDRAPTDAAKELRAAGSAAETMGAITEQRLAEQRLRSLGVRTWRRGAATSGSTRLSALSTREREIALLVSEGATNPEIATAVFLSRKTVERHVSNILAKLGLRNRAELAALMGDQPS